MFLLSVFIGFFVTASLNTNAHMHMNVRTTSTKSGDDESFSI